MASLGESHIKLMDKEKVFFMFVTNRKGSRFLQERLTTATLEQLWSTFTHLRPDFVKISKNMYGNYVAQKYLELGSNELRNNIMETLHPHILSLSRGKFGCRVVQKLLECVVYKHKQVVAQQFAGSIVKYICDQNGNHVVQKILECLDVGEMIFVVQEVSGHTFSLAVHPYGSRVIQRILEKVDRRDARPLLNVIKHHAVVLSKNQYGNYIIQYILKHCPDERKNLVFQLIGRVAELSREKFSSNVIEQAFKVLSIDLVKSLAEELLHDCPMMKGRYPTLALLVDDQYGNYVVQTLVDWSSGAFRRRLLRCLSKCGKLNNDYGKNLLERVTQMLRRNSLKSM